MLAAQVEARRRGVGAWEREMMQLRYEVAEMPSGDVRSAAFDAYLAQVGWARETVAAAGKPVDARRQVLTALETEAAAVRREAFGPDERRRAMEAIEETRAGIYRASVEPGS